MSFLQSPYSPCRLKFAQLLALIAGVLGTDKPTFDIIGDPINIASRLQSTCIPSTIQISEGTYDLIAELPFNVEHRGEVELKGKGKKKTYIVRPMSVGSFMFGSTDSFIPKDKLDSSRIAIGG